MLSIIGTLVLYYIDHRDDAAPPRELTENEKLYFGLHFRPYLAIKERLPELPGGFFWKGRVFNEHNENFVEFSICNLQTEEVIFRHAHNVTQKTKYDIAYADYYHRYPGIARTTVWNEIVPPVVQWANDRVLQLRTGNYVNNEEIF